MTHPVCPPCRAALREELRDGANHHLTLADALYAQGQRGYARRNRVRAAALGWASGWLLRGGR